LSFFFLKKIPTTDIKQTKSNKIDVIISGHYNNQSLISILKENIESWGLSVWTTVDQNASDSAPSNSDTIKNAIKNCRCVLMCKLDKMIILESF
jgi:hypothetical protein